MNETKQLRAITKENMHANYPNENDYSAYFCITKQATTNYGYKESQHAKTKLDNFIQNKDATILPYWMVKILERFDFELPDINSFDIKKIRHLHEYQRLYNAGILPKQVDKMKKALEEINNICYPILDSGKYDSGFMKIVDLVNDALNNK